ncbi:MAG: MarR family winged helix-turn-helix transcriptional regulator [Archangium sp.]
MVKVPGHQLVTDLVLEALKLQHLVQEVASPLAVDVGITAAQWAVVAAIARAGQSLTVPEIAHELRVSRQAVQKQVDGLVSDGLVMREKNAKRQRSPRLALTALGNRLNLRAMHRWGRISSRLARPHSLSALREAGMLVRALVAGLDAENGAKR